MLLKCCQAGLGCAYWEEGNAHARAFIVLTQHGGLGRYMGRRRYGALATLGRSIVSAPCSTTIGILPANAFTDHQYPAGSSAIISEKNRDYKAP